jgi:hypothetical protein
MNDFAVCCWTNCSNGVGRRIRVVELAGRDLSHAADAAVAGELVLLLDALRNEP